MSKVCVEPGICGFLTTIEAKSEDSMNVDLVIDSQCEYIKKLSNELTTINGYNEIFAKFGEGEISKAANKHCSHGACPVPSAMLKAIEVVCSLALPKDVKMIIEK